MPVLALRLTALAALAISVSGCVMEAYGSRARSDAQSWIGLPIQDVIKRFGEPERVTGDAARQKYVWKEYEIATTTTTPTTSRAMAIRPTARS